MRRSTLSRRPNLRRRLPLSSRSQRPSCLRPSQAGVTLLEVLLAVVLTAMIAVPVSAWTISTLRQQQAAEATLANAVSTGELNAVFTADVAAARSVAPTGGDCVGGGGDDGAGGTVRMAMVAAGLEQARIVYSEARPAGASAGSTERSLWRRVCKPDGTLAAAAEVFEELQPDSPALACPNGTVPAPTVEVACDTPSNRRVALSVTPTGPGDSPRPIVVQATRRANADSVGVPGSGNRPPIAQIAASPLVGYVNVPFNFSAARSEDLDGTISSYDWEFPSGSGTVERSGRDVQHSFAAVGEQTVLLRVTDDGGATNVAAVTVRVVNRFPVGAVSISPDVGLRGVDEFTFDATGSYDPDDPDEVLTYEWDLGPGLGDDQFQTGEVVRFVFPASVDKGQRQITLRVTDSLGGTDTLVRAIGVVDELVDPDGIVVVPSPVLVADKTPRVGSVGAGLPPLDVTFARPPGVEIDPGDRWQLLRASDATEVTTNTTTAFSHRFGPTDSGEYQIRLVDGDGEPIAEPVLFRVNAAPTASFSPLPGATGAPRTVQFDPADSVDTDGSIVAWRWNFGFFDQWTSTTRSPTHVFTEPGRYTVLLEVTDDDGAVTRAERTVDVTGPIPTPAAPVWSAGAIEFAAVPGAERYRVAVTCGGSALDLAGGEVAPTATPRLVLSDGACPAPAVAAATVEVQKLSVWSAPSTAAVRP